MTSAPGTTRAATTRAAIIGCGDVAGVHAEALDALGEELNIEFLAVADTDEEAARSFAEKTGTRAYNSMSELLAHEDIDVVHITTPHDAHIDPALEALTAGVHVVLEKPLANELDQAQRLLDHLESQEAGSGRTPKIGVCFQNRYNVSAQQLRRLLDSGELGDIRGAYSSVVWTRTPGYYLSKPWRGQQVRSGGGLLMNQAIHTLDLLQWFLGPVTSLKGTVSTDKYGDTVDVEDSAHALFNHDSGVQSTFYGTLANSRHRNVEIELDCEQALVTLSDGLRVAWADGRVDHYAERTRETGGRSYWGVSHELFIRDFYSRLQDPEPFWIGPAEAMTSLRMAKDIYSSSDNRQ